MTKPKRNNAPTAARRRASSVADLQEQVTFLARELAEARQQQTATSEVLGVISSSPGDLGPVFDTMLGNAVRICGAKFGTLWLCEGDGLRAVALHNAPPAYAEARASVVHPHPETALGRAARTKQVAQITDITTLRRYVEGDPFVVSAVALVVIAAFSSSRCSKRTS
jgi:two-component system NtrC family sensor kinase